MNILFVYPEIPSTFWSFKDALKFVSKKSAEPPVGILTVASMLPADWNKKVIDMNVSKLNDEDILWADYVFLSGMNIQIKSFKDVIRRSNKLGVKVVAGGPLATTQYQDFLGVDHFVLNEAENTLSPFLKDLKNGKAKHIYKSEDFPDITKTPAPAWELLNMKKYASMSLQFSRGCPYDCEFCSITVLNGRRPRTKTKEQFINELDKLYNLGWKGGVSIVDDNFIGNKNVLKKEILPAMIEWNKKHKYPFDFITEVSINLADDDELLNKVVAAGVNSIFVGIETPNEDGLIECGKNQNRKRSLVDSIKKLQKHGLIVSGGFIVGFDSDKPAIFNQQIEFIKNSGIVSAMVGLLNAPFGTRLYKRMKEENRLIEMFSGDNMDASINFRPKMKYSELIGGYDKILQTIYSPKNYYNRVKEFLKVYNLPSWKSSKLTLTDIKAFIRLIWKIGILEKGKPHFWKLFWSTLLKSPKKFQLAMTFAVYGFHFRKIAKAV